MLNQNFVGRNSDTFGTLGDAGGRYVFDLRAANPTFLNEDGTSESCDWTRKEILDNVRRNHWEFISDKKLSKLFPKAKIKITMANTPLAIKKGSLYFNTTSRQVERVIAVQDSSLIWASRHKQEAKPFPRSAFRLANQVEVTNYLAEAAAN